MVAKGKASAKRKQQKEEEEKEKQEQAQKRSKKQEEEKQQQESDDAAADEAEDSEGGSDGEFEEAESSEGEPGNTDIFEAELKQREAQLGKHCMVVGTLDEEEEEEKEEKEGEEGESDDEDGTQPSLEQLRALPRVFVPKKVEEYYAELAEALNKIGDEESEEDEDEEGMDPGMKATMAEAGWSFRMLTTKHSYPMHELLKASLAKADKAIKSNKWEEGFCHWAATVQAARRETHWFQDTDMPEVAEGIYEKLRTQWLKLQKHSDEELGGLVCEGAASSKEAFSVFLQALADDMCSMELKVKDV